MLENLQRHIRKSELYLRALWGREFFISPLASSESVSTPLSYIKENLIFLPEWINTSSISDSYFRAAATHAASHIIYGIDNYSVEGINFLQRNIINLVEDLKVELFAIEKFPGLRNLWLSYHADLEKNEVNALNLMTRLSRSVLDPEYTDEHQWVNKGRELILGHYTDISQPNFSRETGLMLANDLGQMRIPMNSGKYEQPVLYRDDNRFLWHENIEYREKSVSVSTLNQEQIQTQNSKLVELEKGKLIKTSDAMQKGNEGFFIKEDKSADFKFNKESDYKAENRICYPEWDYKIERLKEKWCSLYESKSDAGSSNDIQEILDKYKILLNRLKHIDNKLRLDKFQRVKKMADGDELDIEQLVNAIVDMRIRRTPDTRVYVQNKYRQSKSLVVSILLDLSESTNKVVGEISISDLLRDAVILLGETLSKVDQKFAISGFSSNGRNEINYIKYKDYVETFADSKDRLANIKGEYSTRLGAAMRHCAHDLQQQTADKKILLVITDGEPSDIDVYDQKYLEFDSWQAVKSMQSMGIKPFCMNLDDHADSAIEHIFGKGHYETLTNITRLPEALSSLYIKHVMH